MSRRFISKTFDTSIGWGLVTLGVIVWVYLGHLVWAASHAC